MAPLASSPSAVVIIPIESLRDVDAATGVPQELNKIVAVSGVVTEENFNNAQLSGFIQDGDFGINVFSFNSSLASLARGTRYTITGTIIQFAGLTEISPTAASDVIQLGTGVIPPPRVVTAAEITAAADPQFPEKLEGRLVTMSGMTYVSGTWADPTPIATPASNAVNDIVLKDGAGNNFTIRIAAATGANSPPASYPASITGILSQAAPGTNLFTNYILIPRDPADIVVDQIVSGYASWAAAYPNIGSSDNDADGDNQSNYLEYALGTIPNDRSSAQTLVVTTILGTPALSISKGAAAGVDTGLLFVIEGSRDLTTWETPASPNTPLEQVTNNATTYSVRYLPGTPAKYFFRLKVGPPPPGF